MLRNIYILLFIVILLPFGKEVRAQATCEGGPTTFTEAQIPDYTATATGNFGDGTTGYVEVCISAANIGTAMCSGTAEHLRIRDTDGTLLGTVTAGTALPVCFTSNLNNGLISVQDYCATGSNDYTITWQTMDATSGGSNVCAAPTCSDLIMNGDETGVDCGGATCPACGAPSCSDLVQNQDETGVDCGGTICDPCPTAPDNCTDAESVTPDGSCQTGTTVGAGDSWSGTVGCQSADGHADVWYEFTSTGSNADFTVTNGTQTGDVEIILVLPNCTANNCTCPFALVGTACGASSLTASFNVTAGQLYYYTISSTGSNGTFDHCVETNNNVAPGQDCADAQLLCADGGFTVPNLQNGTGAVSEGGWTSCLAEQNSQWYTFSAATTGSFSAMVAPDSWTAPQTGDDYDWVLLDITSSGCTSSATDLACDFSGCKGSTGFSATGATEFGQTGGTDYQNNDPTGPANCTSGPQWNTTAVTLTAGNTYAYMIQNYTGSTGGATVTFGGTASLVMDASFTGTLAANCYDYSVVLNSAYTGANWTYDWDFGDGVGTSTAAEPSYTYGTDGTYTVSFTMTNGAGCIATGSASVTTGCPLPVELSNFEAECLSGEVKLSWSTSSEQDNKQFIVQRSTDGKSFENIGELEGAGNSNSLIDYRFFDTKPLQKGVYYRLKLVDFDGSAKYSDIISITYCGDYGINVLPNPSKGVFNLIFDQEKNGSFEITIYDVAGKKVLSKEIEVEQAKNKLYSFDLTEFDKGIYFLNVSDGSIIMNKKIVTVK